MYMYVSPHSQFIIVYMYMYMYVSPHSYDLLIHFVIVFLTLIYQFYMYISYLSFPCLNPNLPVSFVILVHISHSHISVLHVHLIQINTILIPMPCSPFSCLSLNPHITVHSYLSHHFSISNAV